MAKEKISSLFSLVVEHKTTGEYVYTIIESKTTFLISTQKLRSDYPFRKAFEIFFDLWMLTTLKDRKNDRILLIKCVE